MVYVHLIAALAVLQYMLFSFLVGRARMQYGVKAPAVTGHAQFERIYRVQMNTLEQLVAFLPMLLLAALYWSPRWVAALGLLWIMGRFIYRHQYLTDPARRAPGFLLTILPTTILLIMTLIGAVGGALASA